MKKIGSLLLILAVMISLCSCMEKNLNNISSVASHSTDVLYHASLGRIPELELKVGMTPDEVENLYKVNDEVEDKTLTIIQSDKIVKMRAYNAVGMYYSDKKDQGISAVVSFVNSYGFENGRASSSDIIAVLGGNIYIPSDDEIIFFPGYVANCTGLLYESGKYTLKFYFIEDMLSATMICSTAGWINEN